MLGYVIGAVIATGVIFGIDAYEHENRDTVLPFNAERIATVYGRTIDIRVIANRNIPVCPDSKIHRELVLYRPGESYPSAPLYHMVIPDESVLAFHEGDLDTHLIAELPAAIKPNANWKYQPTPIDGCAWYVKFLPWYHDIGRAPGPLTPVNVVNTPTPAMTAALPFVPRPALPLKIPVDGAQ
jgi:hypothetical protein